MDTLDWATVGRVVYGAALLTGGLAGLIFWFVVVSFDGAINGMRAPHPLLLPFRVLLQDLRFLLPGQRRRHIIRLVHGPGKRPGDPVPHPGALIVDRYGSYTYQAIADGDLYALVGRRCLPGPALVVLQHLGLPLIPPFVVWVLAEGLSASLILVR